MPDAGAVEAAAGADAFREGNPREIGHPDGRRRGVADTHLAETQDVAPFLEALPDDLRAAEEALFHLLRRHGRAVEEVARATGDFQVDDAAVFR